MTTYIGARKKNGNIKVVEYLDDGTLSCLGVTLYEYFKDISDVKRIMKTTVELIEEDEITFDQYEDTKVYQEYEDFEEMMDEIEPEDNCYIYDGVWKFYSESENTNELTDLDLILEEYL